MKSCPIYKNSEEKNMKQQFCNKQRPGYLGMFTYSLAYYYKFKSDVSLSLTYPKSKNMTVAK